MKLMIRNVHGKVLAVHKNVTIAPIAGSTATVECGSFDIQEVHFDYVLNEINCYSEYYTIFDKFEGTTNIFGVYLESTC